MVTRVAFVYGFRGTTRASEPRVSRPSLEYEPRDPGRSALYAIVRDHFETFREQAAHLREGKGCRGLSRTNSARSCGAAGWPAGSDGSAVSRAGWIGSWRSRARDYGVLGARAALRCQVVPHAPAADPGDVRAGPVRDAETDADSRSPSARGRLWASLFHKFVRGAAPKAATIKGTGIGLVMVPWIAPFDWSPDGKWIAVSLRRFDLRPRSASCRRQTDHCGC